jgi:hypothetical protein
MKNIPAQQKKLIIDTLKKSNIFFSLSDDEM